MISNANKGNQISQWALVTGATSGIGLEIAKNLGQLNQNLIITSRSKNKLSSLKEYLELEHGIEVKTVTGDLTTEEGVDQLISACLAYNIETAVLNAGYGTSGKFTSSILEEELNMLDLNCKSVLRLSHYFSGQFSKRKRGSLVLLSSIVAFQGAPYSANYAASKAYVQSLGEALAVELKPFNVNVLTVAPGPVETGFSRRADMKMGNTISAETVAKEIVSNLDKSKTIFPGSLSKFLIFGLRSVPRWGKIRIMKQVMSGMTRHQLEVNT